MPRLSQQPINVISVCDNADIRPGLEIDTALDAIVASSLRPTSAALSLLYVFFAAGHLLGLPRAVALPMALLAATTALLLLLLHLALGRKPAPPRWAHPIAGGIAAVVLLNSLVHLHVLPDPYQTTNLMLLVIGTGNYFLSARWLLLVHTATLTGWGVIASTAPPSPAWVHFGFALVTATVLSVIIHSLRVQTFRRLERLRFEDEARQAELEAALAAAEQAHRAVEASRNDLETAIEATRQSEERFRQSSETLSTLIAASPLAIVSLGRSGDISSWNTAAERIFGWPPQEVLGHPLPVSLEGEETSGTWLERVLNGESLTDEEAYCRTREGQGLHVSVSAAPLRDAQGSVEGVVAILADITERKKAQEDAERLLLEQVARAQAEEDQRRLAFLADASRTLASSLDCETTLEETARLAVSFLTDWCVVDLLDQELSPRRLVVACADPAKEPLARMLASRYPPDPSRSHPILRVQRTGRSELASEVPDAMLMALAHDAEHLRIMRELGFCSYMSVPLLARGRLLGAMTFIAAESGRRYGGDDLALAEDLASRAALAVDNARLYRQLQQADQRKDQFLAMLAHELRNPLAPIRNAVEILKRIGPAEPRLLRAQEIIARQVSHQAHLLDDLLDVSRITRGRIVLRRRPLDLARLIRNAAEDCRSVLEAAGLTLELSLPDVPVIVEGDPTRLAQVAGNLLQNAAKFTDRGGEVTMRLEVEPGGEHVTLLVRDTGIGIAPEVLPHVFEIFTQADSSLDRSQGGLGLGLALVKGLVALHGGEARAESEGPGRGATFFVRLPLYAGGPAAEAPAGTAALPGGPLRILIVEDNRDAAETLRDLLELSGYTVRVAHSGPDAMATAREFRPEIVVCDLGLPGMSGYQVAAALRQEAGLEKARLIAISGYGQEEDQQRSRAAGFDLHLTKPVDPAELRRLLEVPPDRKHV